MEIVTTSYTVTRYIASDGKEFLNRRACEHYEDDLEKMKHPVIANRVDGLYTFYGQPAALYFISSESDFDFLFKHWLSVNNLETDFDTYGPGWYIYYYVDNGDLPSFNYCYNYHQYEKKIQEKWEHWKTSMFLKMI